MKEIPSVLRLAAYRLERRITFEALAAEMAAKGCAVRTRALHRALTNGLQTMPRDTTLACIADFVASLSPRRRKRAAVRRTRRPAA